MKQFQIRFALILIVLITTIIKATGQTGMPDVFQKNSLKEQLNYLDEHTRIYDNYRAIREDMFQKLISNVSDTLTAANKKLAGFSNSRADLNQTIDSLRADLESTKTKLNEMTTTKNSISLLGVEVNKQAYNKIMWIILGIMLAALVIGFLIFKRNLLLMASTKNDYQELKNEFEAYRKTSREAREKLTMDHFNEIKRIREGR
jgi:uncharacterized coiled-coil DUF342 family protein